MKLKKSLLSRSRRGNVVVYIVLLLMGAFMAMPLVYTISSAFKPYEEIFLFPPKFFVRNPTLDNFTDLFSSAANSLVPFSRYIFNSLFIAVVTTVFQIIIASLAAYPIAKHDFPGKNAYFALIVTSLQKMVSLSGMQSSHFVPAAETVVEKNRIRLDGTLSGPPDNFRRLVLLLSEQPWLSGMEFLNVTPSGALPAYSLGIWATFTQQANTPRH